MLAVHTSVVEPLPHQITAVYEAMLPRQPLRFLLADDPGAGKTIMAGLLIKELVARGDLERCLIVCPGSLAEQWQDELYRRFHLPFEILTNDKLEAARTGNWFLETDLVIARLDKLSRNEDVQQKLQAPAGILYSLNKPDDFILAIVEFSDGDTHRVHYLRQPFQARTGFRRRERQLHAEGSAGQGRRTAVGRAAGSASWSPRAGYDRAIRTVGEF